MDKRAPDNVIRLSTDAFPERTRLAQWREVYGRTVDFVDVQPLDDHPFHASVTIHKLPGLGVVAGSRSAARYHVGKQGLAHKPDDVCLAIVASGEAHVVQCGREASIGAGSALLYSLTDPGVATMRRDGGIVSLLIPRASLQPIAPDLGDARTHQIPAGNRALGLLANYLGLLRSAEIATDPAIARAFATHVVDLTALAIGATGESREIAIARGAKAARLRAAIAEIDARARQPDVSALAIARQLGISERYLRSLLEETGKSLTELLLERRLDLARRSLCDARQNHKTIGEIALDSGFSDISYFNRSFRRRFGDTPSGVRGGRQED